MIGLTFNNHLKIYKTVLAKMRSHFKLTFVSYFSRCLNRGLKWKKKDKQNQLSAGSISAFLYVASKLFCCYVALCSCPYGMLQYGVYRDNYLSRTTKMLIFLTAQGTGSFVFRYNKGHTK